MDFTISAFSWLLDAMFDTVDNRSMISDAKLGPDSATYWSSKYSSIRFPMVLREGYSIPFAVVTRIASSRINPLSLLRTDLKAEEGIASMMTLQSFMSS